MARIIANTYEILQEIGSGGGGVVYLGRHLRLGKLVVLKADRRTLSARPEVLRREVDALKNLSHTYIPQVYDFLEDGGVVYTVMDYIEGESLDKPLKRGERFPQPEAVKWACQLLEALAYLHSRPPHGILHGDVKPANLMLTPQGDIRLIDFNIALALGEEGAVRVGFSRGYASPEHYGTDFSGAAATRSVSDEAATRLDADPATVLSTGSASTAGRRTVLLDVRSDIYSAGATLYHIFTGRRPAADAREVAPIPPEEVSPAIAAILKKAMEPDPARRYQTAEEMLSAFTHLHENDRRTRRRRRRIRTAALLLSALFLTGGGMAFTGLKRMENAQRALTLAEYSANALRRGDTAGALAYAMEALPEKGGPLTPPDAPEALRALTGALGVYDLSDGFKSHMTLPLDSEPLKLALSPGGTRAAALTSGTVTVFDTETGETLAALEADPSALSDAVFSDEDTMLYAGRGALRCRSLTAGRELWSGKAATGIAVSGDGSTVAAVYNDEGLAAVYDADGTPREAVTFHGQRQSVAAADGFADPGGSLFALSGDGSWLAVSFAGGGLRLFDLRDSENDLVLFETSDFTRFEGGFSGRYFAFSATGGGQSVFAVIDTETGEQTGGFADTLPFHVQADGDGICVSSANVLVRLDPETGEQEELAYPDADISAFVRQGAYTLVSTEDGAFSLYGPEAALLKKYTGGGRADFAALAGDFAAVASRDTPSLRLLKRETHPAFLTYDPAFVHDEARLSAGGAAAMLFRHDAFRLCATDGAVLAEVAIPDAEQVYDQQFHRDETGSYLEVIYHDGLRRGWSAEDGRLLFERQGEVPDETMYEEFFTDTLRIASPLHGVPAAYDRETGALVRELEPDAYLTYVTQAGDGILTEYINAQGERYGLLLNGECETLADLPQLCDMTADGTLVFDDHLGNLRVSRMYSTQELKALGRAALQATQEKEETA